MGDGVGVGVGVGTGIGVGMTAELDVRQLVSIKLIATKLINDILMSMVSSVYHIYLLN
tara:strand:- start:15134 stop:15307 length:174 start_codon:yes stop_codon:yes gene_type:complete